jgi:hypothetical protein
MRGLQAQGLQIQGMRTQGMQTQGMQAQGLKSQGLQSQGRVLLEDLNGARLELAAVEAPVVLREGSLLAPSSGDDTLVDEELVVHAQAGRSFTVRVTALGNASGIERFAIAADGVPICAKGDEGVFVAGRWDETGAHRIDGDEVTYSCMSGVIAKCVDWGYAPWSTGTDVHQSCTRLARADYCGDGQPWTMEGTVIDVYDTLGVQSRVGIEEFEFEAAWGEDGALCLAETRYLVEDVDGQIVRPACLATLPVCTSLAQAAELGAVLANESEHTVIGACE